MSSGLFTQKKFLAGLFFLLIGIGTVFVGRDYEMGSVQNMGPGYVPVSLGWILIVLGLSNCFLGARNPEAGQQIEPVPWLALGLVVFSIVAFGLLIERAGLLISVAAAVVISTLANRSINLFQSAIGLVVILILTTLLFVFGLEQPFEYLLPH